jgi:predicted transcriptional regulator
MSLSPIKQEILESMFLCDKPKKAMEIAKEAKKEFQPVMMHLLGLIRMGYVASPEKGFYVITAHGKQALGIPEITKDKSSLNLRLCTTR